MSPKDRLPVSPSTANAHADATADLAQAFQELAQGERTASAMETQLTALEHKIDDLLATIVDAEARGSKVDKSTLETVGSVTGTREAQSEEKWK